MATAYEIRNRLLENGIEIVEKIEDIALNGTEGYEGDLSTLKLVFKTISPFMDISDDPIELTEEDRNSSVDEAIQLYKDGKISHKQALDHARLIGVAQDITDVRDAMKKLDHMLESGKMDALS